MTNTRENRDPRTEEWESLARYDASQIEHVTDRPGHDRRYSLDDSATQRELGWAPTRDFHASLRETVAWYLAHPGWCHAVAGDEFRTFLEANYAGR